TAWSVLPVAVEPPQREQTVMAEGIGVPVVLFGGSTATGATMSDTWVWHGARWQQRAPPASPPGRRLAAMAFDLLRGPPALFGGIGNVFFDDTWEWDGSTWQTMPATGRPHPRAGHALAFDLQSGGVLLFGGSFSNITTFLLFADTWAWNGVSWTQLAPANSP